MIAFKIFIIFGAFHHIVSQYQYKVRSAGIYCNHDSRHVVNLTCYIKAVRGKEGLLYLSWNFTKMPDKDVWLKFTINYRNSKGVYLPYLANFNFDVCKVKTWKSSELSVGTANFLKLLKTVAKAPFVKEGCPLGVGVEITSFDFNDVKKIYLPAIIPEGTFLLYWRFYLGKINHTLIEVKQNMKVINTGIPQLSMLNMG